LFNILHQGTTKKCPTKKKGIYSYKDFKLWVNKEDISIHNFKNTNNNIFDKGLQKAKYPLE